MDLRYRSLDHIPIGGMSWVKIRLPNTTHWVILSIEIIDFLWVNNFDHQYFPTIILLCKQEIRSGCPGGRIDEMCKTKWVRKLVETVWGKLLFHIIMVQWTFSIDIALFKCSHCGNEGFLQFQWIFGCVWPAPYFHQLDFSSWRPWESMCWRLRTPRVNHLSGSEAEARPHRKSSLPPPSSGLPKPPPLRRAKAWSLKWHALSWAAERSKQWNGWSYILDTQVVRITSRLF